MCCQELSLGRQNLNRHSSRACSSRARPRLWPGAPGGPPLGHLVGTWWRPPPSRPGLSEPLAAKRFTNGRTPESRAPTGDRTQVGSGLRPLPTPAVSLRARALLRPQTPRKPHLAGGAMREVRLRFPRGISTAVRLRVHKCETRRGRRLLLRRTAEDKGGAGF